VSKAWAAKGACDAQKEECGERISIHPHYRSYVARIRLLKKTP